MHWESIRNQYPNTQCLHEWLCAVLLPSVDYCPSNHCQPSNIQVSDDNVAHCGDKEELAPAISLYNGWDKADLILLFEFAFGEKFYPHSWFLYYNIFFFSCIATECNCFSYSITYTIYPYFPWLCNPQAHSAPHLSMHPTPILIWHPSQRQFVCHHSKMWLSEPN